MIQAVHDLVPVLGHVTACCDALGIPRASYYRAVAPPAPERARGHRTPPARALTPAERQRILHYLHSERFIDRSPAEVVYALQEEGIYIGSVRTVYRVLASNDEVRERRAQRRHPNYVKPELLATSPNEVWTWDITKLRGPAKWTYYYLYVILDIFSRCVVGWMVAERESADLTRQLIEESCSKQNIQPGQLTMHSDRGPSMQAGLVVHLLALLGVTKTNGRPHVSNDNPFSESQFRTLKYHPTFPERFGGLDDARAFCARFFAWYNQEHHHSALAWLTPETVHYGRADEALAARHACLLAAYQAHPERFVNGPPKRAQLAKAVYINPPTVATGNTEIHEPTPGASPHPPTQQPLP